MRLYISHRASDLLHAPMYRLYRNKPDTAAYIIRECHVTEDIFKYQVVTSISTKALTIPEEREVLNQLKNNELSFIKESILFESLFNLGCKVFHRFRRFFGEQLNFNIPHICVHNRQSVSLLRH